ncbi:MAG: bifunctional 5,10-methylenetetrahydrofolate dehydrogenase/5,10-methenyltetrahydrofolate cyclohydrolase [Acidobacteriota bacterium]
MTARRLDGTVTAAVIRDELVTRIARFTAARGRGPGLGIVLAGGDPASEIYVHNKLRTAAAAGCRAELFRVAATAPLSDLLEVVARLNADDAFDGILVQSPLPQGMGRGAEQRVFDALAPEKDVDGFHPLNVGLLAQKRALLVACTPLGVMELLARERVPLAGKRAVVIGRSDIVGKPMALLLLHQDATVTICHSRTPDVPALAREADILVAAVGRAAYVTPAYVKPGATVIDVGINRVTERDLVEQWFPSGHPRRVQFEAKGSLVIGDVHPDVAGVAGALTPVPGGVGPLTIAMLLHNTVVAAEHRAGLAAG